MTSGEPEDRAARLAERRAKLSAEQQDLLAQRLRQRHLPAAAGSPSPSSLVAIQPAGGRPPFFCVHPAGGDVLCFQALSLHLGPDQPFYGLQSLGLGAGEEPLASIEAMAASYRAEMARVTAGPYHVGGWSLGGTVAFELARQLAAGGSQVALLAIVDATPTPPPGAAGPGAGTRTGAAPSGTAGAEGSADADRAADAHRTADAVGVADAGGAGGANGEGGDDGGDARWLMDIADYLERLWGVALGLSHDALRALPPEEQAVQFLAAMKRTPLGAAGADLDQLQRLLRVFKANVRALRLYRPRPYPGAITLFRAAGADGEPEPAADAEPALGWGALSDRPVEIVEVPGDHISAMAEPHVQTLARQIAARIGRRQQEPRAAMTPGQA